jgi:hypothetical protein
MKTLNYINDKKQRKLLKSLPGFLHQKRKALRAAYGQEKTEIIVNTAIKAYPDIVRVLPTFNTPMYDALMSVASKMAALKKGMKAAGIQTEEFVKFNIEQTRSVAKKVPLVLKKLGGKLYLSNLMRWYLNGVAKSVSANGWPTKLINGTKNDDYVMSVETRDCQMVAFWESIGEGDIRPYCTFFDFTSAELLGVGLKQVSTIDCGVCKYCFYKKGQVSWPHAIQKIIAN